MIVFENKPSTKTPVNDKNLNANFDELLDDIYYKNGDILNITSVVYLNAQISGGSTQVLFTIPLPKRLTKIKSVTLNRYDITVRRVEGGYPLNRATSGVEIEVTPQQGLDNLLKVIVNKSDGLGTTNNSPCGVAIYGFELVFNE